MWSSEKKMHQKKQTKFTFCGIYCKNEIRRRWDVQKWVPPPIHAGERGTDCTFGAPSPAGQFWYNGISVRFGRRILMIIESRKKMVRNLKNSKILFFHQLFSKFHVNRILELQDLPWPWPGVSVHRQ